MNEVFGGVDCLGMPLPIYGTHTGPQNSSTKRKGRKYNTNLFCGVLDGNKITIARYRRQPPCPV